MAITHLLNTPPLTPIVGHVARALDFYKRGDKYFALGKPNPWPNTDGAGNEVPNLPDPNMTEMDELIGYKKCDLQLMVVPDPAGLLTFKNQRWRAVDPENAYTEQARWIWLETTLMPEDFNLTDYRQVGIFSNLVKKTGIVPQQIVLYENAVESPGILEFIDNRRPVLRHADQDEQFVVVLEF